MMAVISTTHERTESMILSDEEIRYYRAILAWEPGYAEEVAKKKMFLKGPVSGEFRILILGSKGCGKTAMLTRFRRGSFAGEGQPPNIEEEYGCRHRIEIQDRIYKVDVLELAPSQLAEGNLLQHAVAITEAAVLMYDVRSRESFLLAQDLHYRIQQVLETDERQYYGIILVGNKADGEDEMDYREVTEGEGYELARSIGLGPHRCLFRETSANTGENVDGVFVSLGAELLRLRRLAQERREEAEVELARMAATAETDSQDLDVSPKRAAKWRLWSQTWRRRTSREPTMKRTVEVVGKYMSL
ncbi:P-loop containing nucleoside triphosphate hydrolase protein [Poronia punctata]|nr:P-loop containing nucleoside triphosphate hydrolase protein [Poronia punctata]